MGLYDDYNTSLTDYATTPIDHNPPYVLPSNKKGSGGGGGFGDSDIPGIGNYGLFGAGLFGFGKDKPKGPPRWQKEANKAYNTGFGALSAYNNLYQPTLDITRRSVADYGDLYRRAANDQLKFDIYSKSQQRGGDVNDFSSLGPEYINALREINPLLAQYYDTAQSDLALGDQLSPSQKRNIQESVRAGQASRGMGLGPSDVYQEAIQTSGYGDVLKQQRQATAKGALGLYGDVFQATTGRPTMSPQPAGATVQAPNAGTGVEDYLSYIVNNQIQGANLDQANKASQMALIGSIIQGVGGMAGGAIGACWVAREVFGARSPKWRLFRKWLFTKAPRPLLRKYLRHGPQAAAWLRRHRDLMPRLRALMESKIAELTPNLGSWTLDLGPS